MMLLSWQSGSTERTLKSFLSAFSKISRMSILLVAEILLQTGISKNQLIVRSFVKDKQRLRELFCEVDLAIMPSRTEGFGLTALEAMSAGLPILVSGNSGFGKALRGFPMGESFVIDSDDPKEWA